MKSSVVVAAAILVGAVSAVNAQNAGGPSFAEAEKVMFPSKDVTVGWGAHQISRGGSSMFVFSTTEYDMGGNEVWSDWTMYQSNHSGTILAVPIGDFKIEQMFEYSAGGSCKTGLVTSVEIQLSTGSKRATDQALHGAVKNLACSGMSISNSNGGKPSHIMALKRSSARRFAGKNPRVHYDAKAGKVYLMLEDCQYTKWDNTYVPATPDGASKSDREKLSKLCRDEDKGGMTFGGFTTEIHPVGSSHVYDRDPDGQGRIIYWK